MLSGILLLAVTTLVSPPAHAQEDAMVVASVRIELDPPKDRGIGRFFYGFGPTLSGKLVFLDAFGREEGGSCPVLVRSRSVGLSWMGADEFNSGLTLGNVDRKAVRQLLGKYYGLQLGGSAYFGANGLVARNSDGTLMGDGSRLEGFGVSLSVPKVTVLADLPRMHEFPKCNWDMRLHSDSDYTGRDSRVTCEVTKNKSVTDAGQAQVQPDPAPQAAGQAATIR